MVTHSLFYTPLSIHGDIMLRLRIRTGRHEQVKHVVPTAVTRLRSRSTAVIRTLHIARPTHAVRIHERLRGAGSDADGCASSGVNDHRPTARGTCSTSRSGATAQTLFVTRLAHAACRVQEG